MVGVRICIDFHLSLEPAISISPVLGASAIKRLRRWSDPCRCRPLGPPPSRKASYTARLFPFLGQVVSRARGDILRFLRLAWHGVTDIDVSKIRVHSTRGRAVTWAPQVASHRSEACLCGGAHVAAACGRGRPHRRQRVACTSHISLAARNHAVTF